MKFSIMTLCASAALAAPAFASEYEEVTVVIEYAAEDLATPAGATSFYESIEATAEKACSFDSIFTPYVPKADAECVEMFLTDAVSQIDNPILAAVHMDAEAPYQVASK